jgi:type IV pilus assembly protein PilW
MKRYIQSRSRAAARRLARFADLREQRGTTLVELMVAITIGVIVLLALAALFGYNSRTRGEIDKASQQIENGRYALDLLRDDIQMAGYFYGYQGESALRQFITPCETTLANLGWQISPPQMPLSISGYASGDTPGGAAGACITNQKANTDVLIIRRSGSEEVSVANAATPPANSDYSASDTFIQVSGCNDGTDTLPTAKPFVVAAGSASSGTFNLHLKNCTTIAPLRKLLVRAYYIGTCSDCTNGGDGIPTLRRAELSGGAISNVALVEGIDSLRVEYLLDTNTSAQVGYGQPDTTRRCKTAVDACDTAPNDWTNVLAVRTTLLARNIAASPEYSDTKTYDMGLAGTLSFSAAADIHYKRHQYSAVVMALNPAGPREPD